MRAFWDGQLCFRQLLPDFEELMQRMQRDSEAATVGARLERLEYGKHPRQWVEWMAGDGPAHLVPVVLHGGYWRALRAEDHRFLLAALRPFGAVVANVEYRLMPEVRLGEVVADAVAALDALARRFPEAGLVPVGHSAGAHLAIAALREVRIARRVAGVVALSGVYDLRPLAHCFVQEELSLSDEEIAAHSLQPETGRVPVLYVNGAAETYEFLRASALMASAGRAQWRVLPEAHHVSLLWTARDNMKELMRVLEGMTGEKWPDSADSREDSGIA